MNWLLLSAVVSCQNATSPHYEPLIAALQLLHSVKKRCQTRRSRAEQHHFRKREVADTRSFGPLEIFRPTIKKILAYQSRQRASRVEANKQDAAPCQGTSNGTSETHEIANIAAIDELHRRHDPAEEPSRQKDEGIGLALLGDDIGKTAVAGMRNQNVALLLAERRAVIVTIIELADARIRDPWV